MNTRRRFFTALGVAAASVGQLAISHAATNDRYYRMGDDPAETASNGAAISTTFDSAGQTGQNQLHDLLASGGPVYRTYTGRPDGNNSLGAEFNGSSQYLRSARFGLPDTTVSSVLSTTLNYSGLTNRGLQFWVRPAATNAQTLVMDTNQHGARINSAGKFSMRYAGTDYASNLSATPGSWYHVMVVRPAGTAGGARMYVNGNAVAAAGGGYNGADTADLVVGANTAGDDGSENGVGFTGGTEEFFNGLIDDLKLFVIGTSNEFAGPPVEPAFNFGDFNFATDNDFAAFKLSGIVGDVDNSGALNAADRTAFIAGWMHDNRVNNIRVPDLNSYSKGDLNLDGITNIQDLVIMQSVLPLAGLSAISTAELFAVPEPMTLLQLMACSLLAVTRRTRRR
jgi:hypothetical protein